MKALTESPNGAAPPLLVWPEQKVPEGGWAENEQPGVMGWAGGLQLDEPLMLSGVLEITEAWLNSTICSSAAEGMGPMGKMPSLGRNQPGFQDLAGPWMAAVLKMNR